MTTTEVLVVLPDGTETTGYRDVMTDGTVYVAYQEGPRPGWRRRRRLERVAAPPPEARP